MVAAQAGPPASFASAACVGAADGSAREGSMEGGWHYLDENRKPVGPFNVEMLRVWTEAG